MRYPDEYDDEELLLREEQAAEPYLLRIAEAEAEAEVLEAEAAVARLMAVFEY